MLTVDSVTALPLFTLSAAHADANEVFRRFVARDGTRAVNGETAAGVSRAKSTTVGDDLTLDVAGVVLVEAGAVLAADDWVQSGADGRAVKWSRPAIRHLVVDGAGANTDIAVAGLAAGDTLDAVVATDGTAVTAPSIASAGNIRSTANTTGKKLLVVWRSPYRRPAGRALLAASAAGKHIPVLLGVT